ncbi:hypothetical protein PUMCH_002688 [Australozyma saopauloensis]|uniref:Kinetochore-associated protein n=1 Tax=Australozyma saopauloensis TaxID=291208 RepID=A0AAX4H9Y5_9ASCO|nr:hypothetical protein PUMCH_002688 [[Candida] saopauloensis]
MSSQNLDLEHQHVRYDRLKRVLEKAVDQTVKRLMDSEQVASCFPQISQVEGGEAILELARKQVASYFRSTSLSQFEHICQERNVELRLNALDDIVIDARKRKEQNSGMQLHIDRLSADELMDAAVVQPKLDAIAKLQLIYDQLCIDNVELYEDLLQQATECDELKSSVVALVDALQSGIDEVKRLDFEANFAKLTEEVFGDTS